MEEMGAMAAGVAPKIAWDANKEVLSWFLDNVVTSMEIVHLAAIGGCCLLEMLFVKNLLFQAL